MGIKVISTNRKAFHDFEIGEKYEAGMSLLGTEVKALRLGKVNLGDGWVDITQDGEAFLREAQIGHYSHGNRQNHEEKRPRRLLLNRSELDKLTRATFEKGYTVVPLQIYFKDRRIKLEIGVGRGKKHYDKRESSKKKDADREIARAMRRSKD